MPQTRYVHVADLVAEFGFTERHWIRMAAASRAPGARQPFGARSRWVFDLDALQTWWDAAEEERSAWSVPPRLFEFIKDGRIPSRKSVPAP